MPDRDAMRLHQYPYIVVRVACEPCGKSGAYRLARLAGKWGAEITLDDLVRRLTYDCPRRADPRGKTRWVDPCMARLPDLRVGGPPPDLPPALAARPLKLIQGGRG